jgi:hypothetical protein
MTFAWHHPNYYKKLKREASSFKGDEEEASSSKPQAPSLKHQAPSSKPKRSDQKIPEPRSTNQQ